jgi:hypothetical protein
MIDRNIIYIKHKVMNNKGYNGYTSLQMMNPES